jgi:hypothetical protein
VNLLGPVAYRNYERRKSRGNPGIAHEWLHMRTTLELSKRYRATWEEFVRATNTLQDSLTAAEPDRARAEVDLLEAEKARLQYNAARDLLVAELSGVRPAANPSSQTLPQDRKVRAIALLLWELAGKPADTALTDWLHAERLVKSASAAIAR